LVGGDGRVATDCDNGVGLLTRLGDLDLSGGKDGGVTVEEVDALLVPVGLVDATEFLDVGIALRLEAGPVELRLVIEPEDEVLERLKATPRTAQSWNRCGKFKVNEATSPGRNRNGKAAQRHADRKV